MVANLAEKQTNKKRKQLLMVSLLSNDGKHGRYDLS